MGATIAGSVHAGRSWPQGRIVANLAASDEIDDGAHVLEVEWLVHDGVGTKLRGLGVKARVSEGGDQDKRWTPGLPPQAAKDAQTIASRHSQVRDDRAGRPDGACGG